jgi:hypothetical protein
MEVMVRTLPSTLDALRILKTRRTRPAGRPPPAAGRALTGALKVLDAKFGHGVEGIKARWGEIVGAGVARRTEPIKLIKARAGGASALEIRVEGPSATIVQHQAADILARVNLFLGAGAVDRLRIVQGPLRGLPRPAGPVAGRARRKGPLDAAAEAALVESLASFPEGPLKNALARLGREVLRSDGR